MARAIVRVLRAPRREVVVGRAGRRLVRLYDLMPGLAERAMARAVERRHLSETRHAAPGSGNLYLPAHGAVATTGG